MSTYKEFQFATIIFIILIPIQILITFLFLTHAGNNPMTPESFAWENIVALLICLLFYGMKTKVDDQTIRIVYGIGLIRKTIMLSEIKSVAVVTTPWYFGWGIRLIPNGMLYNINGLSGVEITFKDKSRIIRIGSGNASALKSAVSSVLNVSH